MTNIPRPSTRLLRALAETQIHDHLCLIYRDSDEGLVSASAFVKAGLEQNDQCVYIADDNTTDAVVAAMKAQGIDVDAALESGQMIIGSKTDAYILSGKFDPDEAINFFALAAKNAQRRGYRAMRGAAEMTWQLGGDPGSERILEYESKMNKHLFPKHAAVGMCQFSIDRFSAQFIRDVIYTHPLVVIGGLVCKNFYYKPPEEYRASTTEGRAELEVSRMLENIFEFEKNERNLQDTQRQLMEANDCLEEKVRERTTELEAKAKRLKDMNSKMAGREYRIRELEHEVSLLRVKLGRKN